MTDRQKAIEAAYEELHSNKSQGGVELTKSNNGFNSFIAGFHAGADWQEAQTGWVPTGEFDKRLLADDNTCFDIVWICLIYRSAHRVMECTHHEGVFDDEWGRKFSKEVTHIRISDMSYEDLDFSTPKEETK